MNPLYNMMYGNSGMPVSQPMFQNPIQKANYIMQAMTNPAAFVRQVIPNLPPEISYDPNQILQWMQQNGMVTQQDIQNAMSQMPRF